MAVIYEPTGRAREYAALAANLYLRCVHGCRYCYAPQVLHVKRQKFHRTSYPRKDILARLRSSALARQRKGLGGQVLLCFASDPYQPHISTEENDRDLTTREAIQILHETGHTVAILTKGGERSIRDFDLLGEGDAYATTLTFTDWEDSQKWEPVAAPPWERWTALLTAHDAGIPTWVSLEPIIDPAQTLALIDITHPYVDKYKVGKLNYHPHAKTIDWHRVAHKVVQRLERYGAAYNLKADLAQHLHDLDYDTRREKCSSSA